MESRRSSEYRVFKIVGRTPSKKSSQTMIVTRKKRPLLLPNKKYMGWIKDAAFQLKSQNKGNPMITGEVTVDTFIFRSNKKRIDLVNMVQSIHDALEEAKVIKNDFQIIGGRDYKFLGSPFDMAYIYIKELYKEY